MKGSASVGTSMTIMSLGGFKSSMSNRCRFGNRYVKSKMFVIGDATLRKTRDWTVSKLRKQLVMEIWSKLERSTRKKTKPWSDLNEVKWGRWLCKKSGSMSLLQGSESLNTRVYEAILSGPGGIALHHRSNLFLPGKETSLKRLRRLRGTHDLATSEHVRRFLGSSWKWSIISSMISWGKTHSMVDVC